MKLLVTVLIFLVSGEVLGVPWPNDAEKIPTVGDVNVSAPPPQPLPSNNSSSTEPNSSTESTSTTPTTKPTTPTTTSAPTTTTMTPTTTAPTTNATTTAPTPTPTTSTTTATPSTTSEKPSTTMAPSSTVAPQPEPPRNRFDGPSFIGGIVLSLGLVAIGFIGFKYYKARSERNYRTL